MLFTTRLGLTSSPSPSTRPRLLTRLPSCKFPLVSSLWSSAWLTIVSSYLNDYNLEYNGAKTDRTVEAVQIILDAGAPIDGVGLQGHLIVGSTPQRSSLVTVLERFTALGLEVAYTEIDVRHETLPPTDAQLAQQGVDFANVVGSCLDVAGCVGVTVWGISDQYSWIPDVFPGAGGALLYDEELGRKPAWTSVSSVLAAAATAAP